MANTRELIWFSLFYEKVGIEIDVSWDAVFRPGNLKKFRVHSNMDPNVCVLRFFPGITVQTLETFMQPPMKGVVLQTYGTAI